jgi:hypothetical protein
MLPSTSIVHSKFRGTIGNRFNRYLHCDVFREEHEEEDICKDTYLETAIEKDHRLEEKLRHKQGPNLRRFSLSQRKQNEKVLQLLRHAVSLEKTQSILSIC